LLLHYQEKDSFSEESLAFIKRYRWVKGVYLYKSQSAPISYCQAYPYEGLSDPLQVLQNKVVEQINKLRSKWGL
jgi:hypothetical protein